jgi:hypothetical protein
MRFTAWQQHQQKKARKRMGLDVKGLRNSIRILQNQVSHLSGELVEARKGYTVRIGCEHPHDYHRDEVIEVRARLFPERWWRGRKMGSAIHRITDDIERIAYETHVNVRKALIEFIQKREPQ